VSKFRRSLASVNGGISTQIDVRAFGVQVKSRKTIFFRSRKTSGLCRRANLFASACRSTAQRRSSPFASIYPSNTLVTDGLCPHKRPTRYAFRFRPSTVVVFPAFPTAPGKLFTGVHRRTLVSDRAVGLRCTKTTLNKRRTSSSAEENVRPRVLPIVCTKRLKKFTSATVPPHTRTHGTCYEQ